MIISFGWLPYHQPRGVSEGAGRLPAMSDAHQVVTAYWAAAEARDWDAFVGLVADDVVYEAPQTRERVCGREAYRRFNAEGFAREWHVTVERVIGEGKHAASWAEFTDGDDRYPALCFFDFGEDGLIARITDFWPAPSKVPADRAYLSERY